MAANGLDLTYAYRSRKPFSSTSSLLNSFFMSTVNVAANSLVSVASNAKNELSGRKWRPADHFRFMLMLTSWFTVWVLRIVMDWFPVALAPSRRLLTHFCGGGDADGSRSSAPLVLPAPSSESWLSMSSSSALGSSALASLSKLDLVPFETVDFGASSVKPLTRALSQILAILNEMPASCQKYQFTMAMAEKIMGENAISGQIELLQVNRAALSAAFARTSSFLYDSLHRTREIEERTRAGTWPSRIIAALPFSAYVTPYIKFLDLAVSAVGAIVPKAEPLNGRRSERGIVEGEYGGEVVVVEKLGQELVWMAEKLREYGAADEAMVQWSFAGGLASASVACNPRIQWCFVKISAMLFQELTRSKEMEETVRPEVKFRMLSLWLPLLCHARNGFTFPALMRFEKDETERAVNHIIGTLSPIDQELILTKWLHDYAISASEWPNLQPSYDRWCNSTRLLAA